MRPPSRSHPGTATAIATGGVVPRGADAVVMIEHTELLDDPNAGDRAAPRGRARTIHRLCGLRHRARRNAAARGTLHRLARDRHAGGLRHCRGRGGPEAARRGAVDRRRTGPAGASRCARPPSTTPTARSSRRRSRKPAASRFPSAPSRTTRPCSARRCARRSPNATWWCCRAAPRKAPAISRTASSRGSARPAFSCTASRSSPASRCALRSRTASRSWCCRAFRPRRSSPSMPSSRR